MLQNLLVLSSAVVLNLFVLVAHLFCLKTLAAPTTTNLDQNVCS